MGVETKDDSVRAVLRAVTQMLVDDVRKTVDDADVNQPLLDRTEYGDFCRVVKEVLEKYLAAEESGMTAMTDAARKKIVSAIEGEFSGLLDKLLGDSGDKSDIRKGMSGILDDFFRKTRKDRKPGVQEADPTGGVLRKFAERLKTAKTGASGVKPFQDAKGTAEYKTFEKTCQKILRGYQNSIQAEASGDEKAKRKPSLI